MIYADHAATTKISETAKLAMLSAMEKDWYNPSSLYTPGQQASGTLMDARVRIARCLGCLPKEIYFTSGGSEADNQAILSAAAIGKRQGKMHIISTAFEHHAVLHTLKKLEKEGFEITLLDVGEKGIVSPAQVEKAIRPDTALVTVMYANNEIGTIQPIREIGAVCRQNGVLFHTDAVQAAGHLPINVEEDQVEHQPQRGRGNDDGEKVQRAEKLRAHANGIHQQRKDQRDAHLKDDCAADEDQRVDKRRVKLGIGKQGGVVGVPWRL